MNDPVPDDAAVYEPDPPASIDTGPVMVEHVRGGAVAEMFVVHCPVKLPLSMTVRVITYEPMTRGAVQVVVVPVAGV